MLFTAFATLAVAASSVLAAPTAPVANKPRSEVLAKARALYKRHNPTFDEVAHVKRNNGGSSNSSSGITDTDILNFALNLEYLEAQYYHICAYGTQLSQDLLNGTGDRGYVADDAGSMVPFNSTLVKQYAEELAFDEMSHVADLRAALGSSAVAMPQLNLNQSFTAAAQAAGIIGKNETFSPYTSDANFLLGALLFEDVGVTAYNGAAPLISSKAYLAAAASILAVEAYHASAIRVNLLTLGQSMPALIDYANKAEAAEGSLGDGKSDGITVNGTAHFVNADSNALAYARTPGQVLNIVYLGTSSTAGGFFPRGVNGNIKMATSSSSSS